MESESKGLIPEHMMAALADYIERGLKPGDFLCAVIRNDMVEARARADIGNLRALQAYAAYLYDEAPAECWGSAEKMEAWMARFTTPPPPLDTGKPKIFVFVNSGRGTDMVSGAALTEDGHFVAGHLSSCRSWFRHDMGLTSNWKHDLYLAHYPDGFDLVEVPDGEERTHDGLRTAYEKHLALAAAEKAAAAGAAAESALPTAG